METDNCLMQTLNFSEQDLAANRQGILTKSQKEYLASIPGHTYPYWVYYVFPFIFWPLFLIGVSSFLLLEQSAAEIQDSVLRIFGFSMCLGVASFPAMLLVTYEKRRTERRMKKDLDIGNVKSLRGSRRRAYREPQTILFLNVDKRVELFTLPKMGIRAFPYEGVYEVHYMPESRFVVSAEYIRDNQADIG